MQQLIHILALAAALIALMAGLWQDWGVFTIVKRSVISYLGFYFVGSAMALVVKLVMSRDIDQKSASNEATKRQQPSP